MSGSICSPSTGPAQSCQFNNGTGCNDACYQSAYTRNICCNNFNLTVDFVRGFITQADAIATTQQFGLVTFADVAQNLFSPIGTGANALNALNGIDYSGGFTNTAGGITFCNTQLPDNPTPVIILLTDGTPTRPSPNPQTAATNAANTFKNSGGTLATVFVSDTASADQAFLNTLASPGFNFTANFQGLQDIVQKVVAFVSCA